VTADGAIRTVNDVHEPDLLWALKGGGGTFGIATRVTLAMHSLPPTFGAVHLTIRSRSDEAYRRLLARFVDHYATDYSLVVQVVPAHLFWNAEVYRQLAGILVKPSGLQTSLSTPW
jgi:FAD/FMN-containing dehydrogenase